MTATTTMLDALNAIQANPLALLEEAHHLTEDQWAELRYTPQMIASLGSLAATYFGKTTYTRIQAETRRHIHTNQLPYCALELIERYAAKLKNPLDQWRLRCMIATGPSQPTEQPCSMRQFAEHAAATYKRFRTPTTSPKPGINLLRRSEGRNWTLLLHGKANDIDHIYRTLQHDPTNAPRVIKQALNGEAGAGIVKIYTPIVQVPLEHATKILDGTQDETLFACSDGIQRTSSELAASLLSDEWGFSLFHPVHGPVDLVFSSRSANFKQRLLGMSEHHTCAWDNCNTPVEHCQWHHMVAWKHGGPTNFDNLVPLCRFHNSWNDDTPWRNTAHGHIERIDGAVKRVFTPGQPYQHRQYGRTLPDIRIRPPNT